MKLKYRYGKCKETFVGKVCWDRYQLCSKPIYYKPNTGYTSLLLYPAELYEKKKLKAPRIWAVYKVDMKPVYLNPLVIGEDTWVLKLTKKPHTPIKPPEEIPIIRRAKYYNCLLNPDVKKSIWYETWWKPWKYYVLGRYYICAKPMQDYVIALQWWDSQVMVVGRIKFVCSERIFYFLELWKRYPRIFRKFGRKYVRIYDKYVAITWKRRIAKRIVW